MPHILYCTVLNTGISSFTTCAIHAIGKSTVAVSVAPKEIKYGFITVRSGRWKTLRAMTLLDIAYLDSDLRYGVGHGTRLVLSLFPPSVLIRQAL